MGTRDEQQVFNTALARVEQANKELTIVYRNATKRLNNKLAVFTQKARKGLLSESQKLQQARIKSFLKSIALDIKKLKNEEQFIITDGFVDTYENGYYGYGYSISKDVNTKVLAGSDFDYSIGYRQLNSGAIRAAYTTTIATEIWGVPLKGRTRADILRMQRQIRIAITQATVEGIGAREAARRLRDIDDIYKQNKNKALATARTEILRGHSFGTEDAILTSQDAGVEGKVIWDATLDGFTRPMHRGMDVQSRNGTQPRKDGLFHFSNGDITSGPRMPGLSAGNSINCRCTKMYLPFGISPNTRGARLEDGTWTEVDGKLDYQQWSETLPGKRSIEKADQYRRDRAKRLAKLRKEGKPIPQIQTISRR